MGRYFPQRNEIERGRQTGEIVWLEEKKQTRPEEKII